MFNLAKYLLVCFLFLSFGLYGQRGVQMSQYMIDKYRVNPAYAGLDYSLSVTGVIRSQYSAILGNPKSQWINAHLPFYKWNGALGVQISNDRVGLYNESRVSSSYNYILDLPSGIFSAGIKVSGVYSRLSGDQIITPEGSYEGNIINHNDPTLSNGLAIGVRPDIEFGIYIRNRFFEGGVTLSNFIPKKYNLENTTISQFPEMSIFVQNSFRIWDIWICKPSILIKTDQSELQTDLNLMVHYNGNVFGGIGFRGYNASSIDAFSMLLGLKLNQNYTLSYSYDIGASSLKNAHEGSHEIVFNYNLNKLIGVGSDPKIIYNPRHL